MLSNKRLIVLCLIQYIIILGFHVVYSLLNCDIAQTRLLFVGSVCVLVFLSVFTFLVPDKQSLIVYVIIFLVLISVSYVGYVIHTLAFGVLIFAVSGIILGMFLNKNYVLVWWIASSLCSILYVVLFPDIILEMVHTKFLYYAYVIVYIIAGINLYILVKNAQNSFNTLKEHSEIQERESSLTNIFWANISNEIRTPMNVINGMSSLLKTENLNTRAREYTDQIENASGMLLNIVNDTLEFSNIESGLVKPSNSVYDIYAVAHNAVLASSSHIRNTGINMVYCINPAVPSALRGDGEFIQKIIIKLLNNATIFTEIGEIRLEIDIDKEKTSNMFCSMIIKISDTGGGIDEKSINNVFNGYESFATGRTAEQEQIGLSLKLVKSMVEAINGNISVSSQLSKGTTFTIEYEAEISTEKELREVMDERNGLSEYEFMAPKLSKVLVIDDTPTNLKLISGMIKLHGIEPDTALSGKEALLLMEKKKYDLVFLDYMMPDMNGVDTLKQIRARASFKNFTDVPVIALTSRSLQRDRDKFINLGFDEFISKPIDDKELEGLLQKFLSDKEKANDTF